MRYYKILFFMGLANGLYANIYMVSNLNNAGAGSFRQAVLDANSNSGLDTIQITAIGTVNLSSQLDQIADSLLIEGNGMFTLDGGGVRRVLSISKDCTIRKVTIRNGGFITSGQQGAGALIVLTATDTCRFMDCQFLDNASLSYAGGISHVTGNLKLERCLFEGNSAMGGIGGGALVVLQTSMSTTIIDCSFEGNIGAPAEAIHVIDGGLVLKGSIEMGLNQSIFLNNSSSIRMEESCVPLGGLLDIVNQ